MKKINEAGETSFGSPPSQTNYYPWGTLGRIFYRFFSSKAKPYIANQGEETPYPKDTQAGDTYTNLDNIKVSMTAEPGAIVLRQVYLPDYEKSRKDRYKQFENMDEYPEISSSFDIYADDATQKDIKGRRWIIDTDSPIVKKEAEELFKNIRLEEHYWDIIRNIVKYGDCFSELILDENNPKLGIQRLKILNPSFLYRVENIYGYVTAFLQEIPKQADFSAFGLQSLNMEKSSYIPLDKNQIVHFRLSTSDPKFYPYGRGVAAGVLRTFKSLKLMEDAMLLYRLSRAPERRVFYVNVGNLPTNKTQAYMDKMKQKLQKEKFYNPVTQTIDERYNPMNVMEDLYIPYRGDKESKVEVLPGAQNLGDIDDVKYFLDKILAGMKVPRDFVVESKDKSPERKANLSQLDVKFAKTVIRVQQHFIHGLEAILRRHLKLRGFPQQWINAVRIKLPDPSDMFTKRKLELDEAKARVIAALMGAGGNPMDPLFSKETIYKEYFEMDEIEIEQEKERVKRQIEEQQAMNPMGMMGGMPGMPGMPGSEPGAEGGEEGGNPTAPDPNVPMVGGRGGMIAQKQPGSAGMDDPANESLKYIKKLILNESSVSKIKTWQRVQEKLNSIKKDNK